MKNFTTNMSIQNINKSKDNPVENNEQEKIDDNMLKKLKLIEKAFK